MLKGALGMPTILNHSEIVRTDDPGGQGYCAAGTRAACYSTWCVRRGEPGVGASGVAVCVRRDGKRVCGRAAISVCVQVGGYG